MLVSDIMKKPPATCKTHDTVTDAAKIMHEHRCGFVPVVDPHGAVVGVVTDRDVCLTVGDKNRAMTHVSVQDAMSNHVFSCYADENVKTALATMAKRHVRRLPALDRHGHLQGVLSIDDVIQAPPHRGSPTAEDIVAALKGITAAQPVEVVQP
jgi:CBS domain-containing protein